MGRRQESVLCSQNKIIEAEYKESFPVLETKLLNSMALPLVKVTLAVSHRYRWHHRWDSE